MTTTTTMANNNPPPEPSALSSLITSSGAKTASESLPLEILHNLQYQHNWTDLKRHIVHLNVAASSTPSTAASGETTATLISGLPPRHSYVHPDLQNYLVRHSIDESSIPVQREFVLPLSLSETWTLGRFCAVFDQLPERDVVSVQPPAPRSDDGRQSQSRNGSGNANGNGSVHVHVHGRPTAYEHHDQKRVLLGMRAKTGGGGDGTVVYYIMQEGEVKPRQNG
jgi:hypothetical protein